MNFSSPNHTSIPPQPRLRRQSTLTPDVGKLSHVLSMDITEPRTLLAYLPDENTEKEEYKKKKTENECLQSQSNYGKKGPIAWFFTVGEYSRKFLSFVGPGYIIAVGYMDPGNWATDLAGGSQFGYTLLFIILLSNFVAIMLQALSIKLGIVTGLDLAQACRKNIRWKYLNWVLYVVCELAMIATDLAEVIGSAIALNMLFGLALPYGVIVTGLDVFIILLFYKDNVVDQPVSSASSTMTATGVTTGLKKGQDHQTMVLRPKVSINALRAFEYLVMALVGAVGVCFVMELAYSNVNLRNVVLGYLPINSEIVTNPNCLYVAIGIIGATVMPHNLYLHSHLVKARRHRDLVENPSLSATSLRHTIAQTLHFSLIDSAVALTFALFVNSSILIVSAANFFYAPKGSQQSVGDLFSAHDLLSEYLSPAAGLVFALGLLFSGQSSTITATMAGQIIMEGFLDIRLQPWLRRLLTRSLAIIPAAIIAAVRGRSGLNELLVASQVALSLQLPFAVIPLVIFTGWSKDMCLQSEEEYEDSPMEMVVSEDSPSKSIDSNTTVVATIPPQLPSITEIDVIESLPPSKPKTTSKRRHGRDPLDFSDPWWLRILGVTASTAIVGLNIYLMVEIFSGNT